MRNVAEAKRQLKQQNIYFSKSKNLKPETELQEDRKTLISPSLQPKMIKNALNVSKIDLDSKLSINMLLSNHRANAVF